MRLLLVCFLWFLVSLHVVGAAVWFRRRFPQESPWFGFIFPSLAFVCVFNFVEHCIGLPTLLYLLPVTGLICAWGLFLPGTNWKGLRLPTGIFLVAFAFTLLLRAVKPDILFVSSGTYDLTIFSSFCMGEKLPPAYSWCPPYTIGGYYAFQHYCASVLTRLFNLDVGTGFNISSALLSAWICFAIAAAAWVISRRSVWITIVAAVLTECAANGTNAYLTLTIPNLDPILSSCLFFGFDDPANKNWLVHLLVPPPDPWERREMEIPGFWGWLGTFHGTCGGQFLCIFSTWCLAEVLRRRPSLFPWIGLAISPVLAIITSTWAVPMTGSLLVAGLLAAWYLGVAPRNPRFVLVTLSILSMLLAPSLLEFLPSRIDYYINELTPTRHTQWIEFGAYWWPVVLPYLFLVFVWKRLNPAVKIVWLLAPAFYAFIEMNSFGARTDTTGKLWGFLWGITWSAFLPAIAMRKGIAFRILFGILCLSGVISLWSWSSWTWRTIAWDRDVFQLESTGHFQGGVGSKLYRTLSQMQNQVILVGLPAWNCPDNGALANLTKNYTYIEGCWFVDRFFCPSGLGMGAQRDTEIKEFYTGQISDPLLFLRRNKITAVTIWPDDNISEAILSKLKEALVPTYEYMDFREPGGPAAGIFVYQPWVQGIAKPPVSLTPPASALTNAPPIAGAAASAPEAAATNAAPVAIAPAPEVAAPQVAPAVAPAAEAVPVPVPPTPTPEAAVTTNTSSVAPVAPPTGATSTNAPPLPAAPASPAPNP